MANIPGAPAAINLAVGDCAEQKTLEFMLYQQQFNEAFCNFLTGLTGGNTTIEVLREKGSFQGNGPDLTFYNPSVPFTTNCCVIISGGVCLDSFTRSNQTQNDQTTPYTTTTEIKCDGVVVDSYEVVEDITVEAGSSVTVPKRTVLIQSTLDVANLGKTPNPGTLQVCTTTPAGTSVSQDVTLTTLVFCASEIS